MSNNNYSYSANSFNPLTDTKSKIPLALVGVSGIAALFLGVGLQFWDHPSREMVIERDPTLSLPYTDNFPLYSVYLLAYLPALILSGIIQRKIKYLIHIFSVLSLVSFITTILQTYLAVPRPCFFAVCNYKGYREALETENFTSYLSNTVPGIPGVIEYCSSPQEDIDMSLRSFPCQYSALISMAAFIMSHYLWNNPKLVTKNSSILVEEIMIIIFRILSILYWAGAIIVSVARLHVNANFPADIVAGWLVSLLVFLGYKIMFTKSKSNKKNDLLSYYDTN